MLETQVLWSDSFSHEVSGLCCHRQWGGTAHLSAFVTTPPQPIFGYISLQQEWFGVVSKHQDGSCHAHLF